MTRSRLATRLGAVLVLLVAWWRLATTRLGAVLLLLAACSNGGGGGGAASTTRTGRMGSDPSVPPEGALRVIDLAATGVQANTVLTDGSSLWLAGSGPPEGGRVVRIDLRSGRVAWSVDVPDDIVGLAVADSGVLFAGGGGDGADPNGGVTRLDSESGRMLGTLETPGGSPSAVTAVPEAVWVTDARSDQLWRLEPRRGTVEGTVRVARSPTAAAFSPAGNTLWVASPDAGVVTRLDATTGRVRGTVDVPTANSLVATPGAVWAGGSALVRLDPTTGAKMAEIPTRTVTLVQATSDGWIWAHEVHGALIRGAAQELRLDPRPSGAATGDFVAAAVAGDRLFVYEPDLDRVVEWKLPLQSGLDFPAEQPHEGVNFGFIRAMGEGTVTFDPAEELAGRQATEVAALDGASVTKAERLPGGIYDRNRDGDTHVLRLRSGAELVLLKPRGNRPTPVTVDPPTFRRARTPTGGGEFAGAPGSAPYHVTMENGVVTRVEQVYRP